MDDLISIGTFTQPHGLHGALKLRASGNPGAVTALKRVFVAARGWMTVREAALHNVIPVLSLAGVNSREDALALSGLEVFADKSALPLEEGVYYYHDLIGRAVVAPDGSSLGVVVRMVDSGAQDIIVVKHGEREVLVPLQAPYVRVLETTLEIEPVPGLFED
jgi:16S rRNA processing protein RimM